MSIYAEPYSFFEIDSVINFNCVEPIEMCLPIYLETDLHGFHLNTNDSPTVPPEVEDVPEYPLVSYCYRLVSKCDEPVIIVDKIKHYNQFFYFINPITEDWILLPFNDDDDEPDVIPGFNQFQCNDCFYIQIIKTVREVNPDQETEFDPYLYRNSIVGCIGCFKKICDPCYTTLINYRNNENAFGFNNNNRTYNQIRLPFYLKQPQFPTKRNVFTLSNGMQKKLSARIEKEWIVDTEYMPKEWHEKLIIALEHDRVKITNTNSNLTNQEIMFDSNYEINWQDFLDYPTAPAKFKVKQIPYNNINSNCL